MGIISGDALRVGFLGTVVAPRHKAEVATPLVHSELEAVWWNGAAFLYLRLA